MTARYGALSNFFLKVSDLMLVLCALAVTIVFRYSPTHHNVGFAFDYLSERIKVSNALVGSALLMIWHLAFAVQGLYLSHRFASHRKELKEIAQAIVICSTVLLVGAQVGNWPTINFTTILIFAGVSFGLIAGMRMVLRLNLRRLRKRGYNVKAVLIIGGGARSRRFAGRIQRRQDLGYKLVGYVESDAEFADKTVGGAPWLGSLEELPAILANEVIDEA